MAASLLVALSASSALGADDVVASDGVSVRATVLPEKPPATDAPNATAGEGQAQAPPETTDGPVRLGAPAILTLEVSAPAGTQLFVHDNPDLGSFRRVGEPLPVERKVESGLEVAIHRVRVLPMRYGVEVIPPIEIPFRLAGDRDGTVSTKPIKVRVRGNLENSANPTLGGLPKPVDVIATNWALIWGLSILGAAILATLITLVCLRIWRQQLAAAVPPPPPLPPNELALKQLAALETSTGDPDARYAAVVDVLREYLGGRYGFDGLETTTHEMLAEIAVPEADLKSITVTEIQDFLEDADLIKFARMTTTEEDASQRIPVVRRIVEATWEPPPEEVVEEVAPKLEPADGPERIKAGAIDVVLGGALAGVSFAGFWIAGALEWGWASIVLLGLFLWLRDVGGRSPGKVLMGLRVVNRGEFQTAPTSGALVTRNALLLIAPLGLPAELLVLAYHPLGTRVGDHLAGTEVVRAGEVAR